MPTIRRAVEKVRVTRDDLLAWDGQNILAARVERATLMASLKAWAAGKFHADGWELVVQQWMEPGTGTITHVIYVRHRITGQYWEGE